MKIIDLINSIDFENCEKPLFVLGGDFLTISRKNGFFVEENDKSSIVTAYHAFYDAKTKSGKQDRFSDFVDLLSKYSDKEETREEIEALLKEKLHLQL